MEYYEDYSPALQKLLSYVKTAYVWKLKESRPSSWVGESGRIVVIGDAAHASLPWVGQVSSISTDSSAPPHTHDRSREVAWHSRTGHVLRSV